MLFTINLRYEIRQDFIINLIVIRLRDVTKGNQEDLLP